MTADDDVLDTAALPPRLAPLAGDEITALADGTPALVWATITHGGRTWRGLTLIAEGEARRADLGWVGDRVWHPLDSVSDVYSAIDPGGTR